MMMLFAAGTVIGALALRPKCAETVVSTTTAAPAPVASMPDPLAIASYATPGIAAARRNVFAFHPVDEGARRAPLPVESNNVRPPDRETPEPPKATTEPAARYLGAFGPQGNPILVFKQNGDVVNVPLRKP